MFQKWYSLLLWYVIPQYPKSPPCFLSERGHRHRMDAVMAAMTMPPLPISVLLYKLGPAKSTSLI